MRFSSNIALLNHGSVRRIELRYDNHPLCSAEVLALWQTNKDFAWYFSQLLAQAPFAACFWEVPPLTLASVEQPFEFVLVECPQLAAMKADPSAFSSHFSRTDRDAVVAFMNLGQDALLVVPCPDEPAGEYTHLTAFSRMAPAHQQQVFWQRVGLEVEKRLSDQPLWVSTSGLGVYWLHVRLDIRPKYYTWRPYTVI